MGRTGIEHPTENVTFAVPPASGAPKDDKRGGTRNLASLPDIETYADTDAENIPKDANSCRSDPKGTRVGGENGGVQRPSDSVTNAREYEVKCGGCSGGLAVRPNGSFVITPGDLVALDLARSATHVEPGTTSVRRTSRRANRNAM